MRQTKLEKQVDTDTEKAFRVHFDRVQIPIMDIPGIYQRARVLMQKDNYTADDAVKIIAQIYKEEAT